MWGCGEEAFCIHAVQCRVIRVYIFILVKNKKCGAVEKKRFEPTARSHSGGDSPSTGYITTIMAKLYI
jgi:hypothetical protein